MNNPIFFVFKRLFSFNFVILKKENPETLSIAWILLIGLLFRSFVAFWLLPGYDEGYYYLYTKHLDWSYFDHPIMVALTTGLGIWLTGITSPFTLRIGTLIL